MQALFEVAREKQPSVIFFDEIDALMSARKVLLPFLLLVFDALTRCGLAVALNLGVTSVPPDHNTECFRVPFLCTYHRRTSTRRRGG
jgi:hypothetical protein